jgi:DNA-damage-inducible protein J
MTNITIRIDDRVKHDAETLFDSLGLSISGAVNVFFRQAIREQAIPFPIKAKTAEEKYNEYFTPQTVERILKSEKQAERGEVITFTLAELEAMETGEIPQRALDFIESHKKAGTAKQACV